MTYKQLLRNWRRKENEQKQYLELVQNALQDALAHCPQGTGKTKGLILPMIYANMRQTALDEVCEKIAQNLTDTIETEW